MEHKTFLHLISPVKDKMYRFALRLLTSKEAAEDATQEVLLKLWSRTEKFNNYANIEAFAMTVTKNHCLDQLKSKKNNNLRIVHQNFENNALSPQREVELNDELNWVEKIISDLPEQQKMLFQLRDIEHYEFNEIEKITGLKPIAIRVGLSRARKRIRESLTKKHDYGIAKN